MTTANLGHGDPLVLLDIALKVALLVGWVLIAGLGALLFAGGAGIVLRKVLGVRWLLALVLPLFTCALLVLLVRASADNQSLIPDHLLLRIGVPVVLIVSLSVGVLI